MKYLYGASVQGIQNFIFETNKLKEIVGASEIIEFICTNLFQMNVNDFRKENLILGAAGQIKYIFNHRDDCQELALSFPRTVIKHAPGITLSQAVVPYGGELTPELLRELDRRLKIQRNKSRSQHGLGLMVSERSRRTGKPGVAKENKVVIDAAQRQKLALSTNAGNKLLEKLMGTEFNKEVDIYPKEMDDLIWNKENQWIAVVHADGNNLGKRILKMGNTINPSVTKEAFKELSINLESATVEAVKIAFRQTIPLPENNQKLPIRPLILGGDDLTVVIRGDLAIPFTHQFLTHFEKETKRAFESFESKFGIPYFKNGLTTCAGIAFIKPNYPFHYGVRLAEELCSYAKNISKNLPEVGQNAPSCLNFHKVHSSFVESYHRIIEDQLTAKGIQFNYGPYFLDTQAKYATISQLLKWNAKIIEHEAPKSQLRNWLSEIKVDAQSANQYLKRIRQITHRRYERDLQLSQPTISRKDEHQEEVFYTHLYDVLTLSSIMKN